MGKKAAWLINCLETNPYNIFDGIEYVCLRKENQGALMFDILKILFLTDLGGEGEREKVGSQLPDTKC